MTKAELLEALEYYPDDAHVVATVVTPNGIFVPKEGVKFDLHDVWIDGTGVVNLIAVTISSAVDPNLRQENGL